MYSSKDVSPSTSSDVSQLALATNEYRVYGRRWFLLATVFVLNLSNAMIWLTFGPVAYKAQEFYQTDLDTINWLSVVFMITGIPCGIVATWLLDTIGLRFSIILSSWLNCIGCVLRLISAINGISQPAMVPLLFVGQTIAALAQPFILFAPTKLSALWFHYDQRAIANMLATIANPLGIMIAYISSPLIARTSSQSDIFLMLAIQCAPAGLAVVMATFGWWSSKPPTPPTASAVTNSEPFVVGVKALAKNYRYYVLAWCVGGGIALFSVMTTLLSQMLCPWGYTDTYVGTVCVSSLIGAGFFGAGLAGVIVDKTKRFLEVTKTCYILAVVALVVFAILHNHSGQWVVLAVMCGMFGFFGIPIYPVGNELAVETTYPVGEATSSGIVFMLGQLQGIVLVIVLGSIGVKLDEDKLLTNKCVSENLGDIPVLDMSVPVYVMVGYAGCLALAYVLLFRTEYRRLKAESETPDNSEKDAYFVAKELSYTEGKPIEMIAKF